MREWLRDHGLLIASLLLFVIFFVGMVLVGFRVCTRSCWRWRHWPRSYSR